MHADVARQAFELLGERQELAHFLLGRLALVDQRLDLARVDHVGFGLAFATLERHELARLEGNELRDAVDERIREIENPTDVAYRCLGGERAERRDLRHRVGAVFLLDVIDDAVAAVLAEVDVEVRHRHPLGIEEPLEQQRVAQRIEIGDAEGVRDERPGTRSAARPYRHAIALRPVDEVRDDEKVAGESHLDDGRGLEVEARDVLGALLLAQLRIGIERLEATLESRGGFVAQVLVDRDARGRRKFGQVILAERDGEVASLRDGDGVGDRLRQVGELCRHFRLRREVLLRREAARAAGVGEDVALGDANAGFVRAEVVARGELHGMRGHDRQRELACDADGRGDERVVLRESRPLDFEIVAIGESRRPRARRALGGLGVALQQCDADVAVTAARQGDEAVRAFVEPLAAKLGASAMLVGAKRTRHPVAQAQIPAAIGGEQDSAIRQVALVVVRDPYVAAGNGLDARRACGAIELDEPESVRQVGDRERGHAVGSGGRDCFVDAQRAVDDRVLAVQAQVNERRGRHQENVALRRRR